MWQVYDVSPDGQRFLMFKNAEFDTQTEPRRDVIIVQNWAADLERLVPTE
jgi:hypothetical protein